MNRKNQIDKSFALNISSSEELTVDQLEKAYKLDSDVCKSKANKNCTNNVRCLNGLGEKAWLSESDDNLFDESGDPNTRRRTPGNFVGLKNLGATCYVNSFLQVWFHNPVLRQMIYNWRPEEDPDENKFHSQSILVSVDLQSNPNSDYHPIGSIGKLQLIFGLMQFGVRPSVDPTPIIECLQLNSSEQQDAHEFSNLFITHIEKRLQFQRDESIRKTIENQYCGKCVYITRCQFCGEDSRKESQFYELDLNIKGYKDIYECLGDYLKEESLDGSNQYFCGYCQSKQNAKRFIQLRKLPPILNLQLLRFVYDPLKGGRKKLNSFLKFPDTLDMKPFINSITNVPKEETTYHLSAVLIHRGSSAHSGHYIAHIKDRNTGFWYKFNDEKAERIEGKKLKLDSDEATENCLNGGGDNSPKFEKIKDHDWHHSNNAYLLVYKNETQLPSNLSHNYKDWNLPQYLINAIEEDNKKFDETIAEFQQKRDIIIKECIKHRSDVRSIYKNLVALPNEPYDLISKKWLNNWLKCKSSADLKPVDNNKLLCVHSKLSLKFLSSFKCISTTGADQIYGIYGGGPRLNRDSLCRVCVSKQIDIVKTRTKLDEDQKFISSQFRFKPDEDSYWVGKDSLKSWKQIKMKSIENDYPNENDDSSNSDHEIKTDENGFEDSNFNDDLICEHEGLIPDESNRRLVSAEVWRIFKSHFPKAPEFHKDSDVCEKCVLINKELQRVKIGYKEMADKQKSSLQDLSNERRRLTWSDLSLVGDYFALSRKFLKEWKKFINDPAKHNPPESIENKQLLCAHNKFLYPVFETEVIGTDSKFVIISKQEWDSLKEFYSYDSMIHFHVLLDENNSKTIESTPTYCDSCNKSLKLHEEHDRLTYKNQYIFVRKTENNESHSDTCEKPDETSESYQTIGKKLKKEETKQVYGNGDNQVLRRSSRRRKHKNEKEIKVSSTDTLKDLKVQIMKLFSVATFDQHLTINDRTLVGNDKTLAQLRVEPQSIITLKVDEEPSGDCTLIEDDYIKGSAPEIGFKENVPECTDKKTIVGSKYDLKN